MPNKKLVRLILILSVFAGVIYNSWPLGFVLNNSVARIGLASDLGASGQPYSWLFIWLDVLTGIIILVITGLIYPMISRRVSRNFFAFKLILGGLILFSTFTTLSAVVPLKCTGLIAKCGVTANQIFSFHGIASALASVGILASLVSLLIFENYLPKLATKIVKLVLIAWSVLGLTYLIALTNIKVRFVEDAFLVISGLAIVVVVWAACMIKIDASSKNLKDF